METKDVTQRGERAIVYTKWLVESRGTSKWSEHHHQQQPQPSSPRIQKIRANALRKRNVFADIDADAGGKVARLKVLR